MNIQPHTLTTDELLRFHADSPLAAPMHRLLEQLEQACKALTAARSLQDAAGAVVSGLCGDPAECMKKLPDLIEALGATADTFGEVDDGELGS